MDIEALLRRLEIEVQRLQQIQCLLQEDANRTTLLRKLHLTNQALTDIKTDLALGNAQCCLSIIKHHPDDPILQEELQKLIQLFCTASHGVTSARSQNS